MLLVNKKSTMSELTQSSKGVTHSPIQALVELQNSEPDKARRNIQIHSCIKLSLIWSNAMNGKNNSAYLLKVRYL